MNAVRIATTVNGVRYERDVEPRLLLVDFLREDLDLVGTHVGCEHGVCGTCTVLLNGESIRSCIAFAVQADGAEITTVEGLVAERRHAPAPGGVSGTTRGCSAATARPACCCSRDELLRENPHRRAAEVTRGDREQPVPLYGLPVHRRGRARRGGEDARRGRHEPPGDKQPATDVPEAPERVLGGEEGS